MAISRSSSNLLSITAGQHSWGINGCWRVWRLGEWVRAFSIASDCVRKHFVRKHLLSRPLASNLMAAAGLMQQNLALARAACQVSRCTVSPDLRDMPSHCFLTLDLTYIFFRHAAAHIVTAVPLKPSTGIVGMYPAILPPCG